MLLKFQLVFSNTDESQFNPITDTFYISGSSKYLGEWNLTDAIEMKLKTNKFISNDTGSISSQSSQSSTYSDIYVEECQSVISLNNVNSLSNSPKFTSLEFEANVYINDFMDNESLVADLEKLNYKYFIGQKTTHIEKGEKFFLKEIEYNWRKLEKLPQKMSNLSIIDINDSWPVFDQDNKQSRIDHGWLLENETEFQFHFSDGPCQLWLPNNTEKPIYIDIIPWTTNAGLSKLKDFYNTHMDFNENQVVPNKKTPFNAFNSSSTYSSYRIRTFEKPINLLFQFNIHELEKDGSLNENYIATGYFRVSKTLIDNSIAEVDISLLNNNQISGTLKAEILLITSLKDPSNFIVTKNYNYHFNRSCIPIGHRGMGKTFDAGTLPNTNFVENTIESFREAYNRGAQMVEFDVVLTKDKKPIVYHDFVFCIDQINNKTEAQSQGKYLSIAVNQLTYDEVKQNRIYSHKILKSLSTDKLDAEDPNSFTSHLMFPTLREMCNELDQKLGFNVEIKYPIDLEDGTQEVDNHIKWLNRNEYVDIIIKDLMECTKFDDKRCIIITTFDPNLCSMLRMKQNRFPVLFLTNGITNKWKKYKDFRCKNTQISLNYARAECLHGIVAHAEELTKNLHLINILFSHTSKTANFYAYSWGDDLNESDKRDMFSKSGINGIIYDRINEPILENQIF